MSGVSVIPNFMHNAPQIGIDLIIPVYRNPILTKRCIDSIITNVGEIEHHDPRIVLIDDSPDDLETSDLLRGYAATDGRFVLMANAANCGFVKSVNRGLELATKAGRDVILVNSDTQTFPGTLEKIARIALSDSQIGFVSPRSNNASICSLPHFYGGSVPSPDQAYANWRSISHLLPEFHFTPTAIGFYLYIKNSILRNFGGLKEDFGVGYEEENDLIIRANKAGFRPALANHAFAYHAGSASFGLIDLDLKTHQAENLRKLSGIHSEFIPLVRRYEKSPHFRAERMLAELVDLGRRNIEVVFEMTGLGPNHNGTNEFALAVIRTFHARHTGRFNITVLCSPEAYDFHRLADLKALRRENEWSPGRYALAIKLGQPFDLHQINIMEELAPINLYAMLDTIADDCGYLSVTHQLDVLWRHVANHANGLLYISRFSEQMFVSRYPEAALLPALARLLPTRLSSYPVERLPQGGRHVLILGNHFAHKGSDATARVLASRFPRMRFVVLGANSSESNNLRSYRSGTLDAGRIEQLFAEASVVILPSFVEGFGFGLLHALTRHKAVLARRIDATLEILHTYKSYHGVQLYDDDEQLARMLAEVSSYAKSEVDDSAAAGWEEWADALADFCLDSIRKTDIFTRCERRLRATDTLRRALAWDQHVATHPHITQAGTPTGAATVAIPATSIDSLLANDGSKFIEGVYSALLGRPPDTSGETYYFGRLDGGVSKLQIIREISDSAEARKRGAVVTGLEEALQALPHRRMAAVKRLLRRI